MGNGSNSLFFWFRLGMLLKSEIDTVRNSGLEGEPVGSRGVLFLF